MRKNKLGMAIMIGAGLGIGVKMLIDKTNALYILQKKYDTLSEEFEMFCDTKYKDDERPSKDKAIIEFIKQHPYYEETLGELMNKVKESLTSEHSGCGGCGGTGHCTKYVTKPIVKDTPDVDKETEECCTAKDVSEEAKDDMPVVPADVAAEMQKKDAETESDTKDSSDAVGDSDSVAKED